MSKLLLLIAFGALLYLWLRRAKRPERQEAPAPEAMVQCAYCRVHVPLGEALISGDKRFCCEEHRRLGQS